MQSPDFFRQYKVNKAGDYFELKVKENDIALSFWSNNRLPYSIEYTLNNEKITIYKEKPDSANKYDHFEKSFRPSCKTLTDVIKSIDEHKDKLFSEDEKDIKQAINNLHNMYFNAKKDDEKKIPIIKNTINAENNSPNKDIQKKKNNHHDTSCKTKFTHEVKFDNACVKYNRDRIQIEYYIDEGMIGLVNNKHNQEKHERQICRYVITGEIDKADRKLKLTKTLLNNDTGYINVALDGNEDIISLIKKMLSEILNIRGWLCCNEGEILGSILNDIDKNDKMEALQAINNEIFEEIKNDNHSNFIVNKDTNIIINGGLNEKAKENNLNASKINAEIKIKDDKVVISFYEPSEERLWICEKEANNSSCRKYVDPTDEADVGNYIVLENNNNENKYINKNECYRHSFVDKKKVKEVELDIKLLQEGKGMVLKVGKVSTFKLVKSKAFNNEYEYEKIEQEKMIKDYLCLLKDYRTLDIGSDKDIKILNFLFSSCKKKIHDNMNKDNNIEDTDALRQQRDEVAALYNALVKAIAKCFSFKENIIKLGADKFLRIELPYNKGQFLITINPAKKEMTYNNQTCQYTDDKTMRQFIKENLYRDCLNDNFEEYMKTTWNKKIEKFVDELDLSEVIGKKMKNDTVKPLCPNPCTKCFGYI